VQKIQVLLIETRITGNLHENPCKLIVISLSFLLRIRNVSGKFVRKINTHILRNFFSQSRAVYTTLRNMVERDRPQMII
jgi:hypothetical protein